MADFLLRIDAGRATGPLFDNRAQRAIDDWADEMEEEGADFALDVIKDIYHAEFRQPTGYYESNVRTRRTGGHWEVWDGGQAGPVYGPWLEGVGSRNNTTRFKGYHAFRRAASALDRHIDAIGDRIFRDRIRRRLE